MVHGNLQFTMRIAFRCVLHRCASQDIHCWKFFWLFYSISDTIRLPKKPRSLWKRKSGKRKSISVWFLYIYKEKYVVRWKRKQIQRLGNGLKGYSTSWSNNSVVWSTATKHYTHDMYVYNAGAAQQTNMLPFNRMCEWSFRRFTYGNRVTTFASFRGLYLRNFSTNNASEDGQSDEFTGPSDRLQRRAVCTKGRDVIGASCWLAPTRHSSLKINNCNNLSPSRCILKRLPRPAGQG